MIAVEKIWLYEHGQGHCGFDLYREEEGILFIDKFIRNPRIELFTPDRLTRIRRRFEDRLRKDDCLLIKAIYCTGLMSDRFLT